MEAAQQGAHGDTPEQAQLAWAALAVTRREFGSKATILNNFATTSTGQLVGVPTTAETASATASVTSDPATDFIRTLFGNGTADHPDGGVHEFAQAMAALHRATVSTGPRGLLNQNSNSQAKFSFRHRGHL